MRRSLAVSGVGLVMAAVGVGIYPLAEGWFSSTSMPSQPVAASPSIGSVSPSPTPANRPSPSRAKTSAISPLVQPKKEAVPMWLSIPSIGIDESITPTGLTSRGELEPPPGHTIWYNGSSKPGAVGISVIAGHVQWGSTPDNFWRLADVPDGALFSIRYSDGAVLNFAVINRKSELKTDVQHDPSVWGASPTPVVVLITCDKDPKRSPLINHHFTNNWLVFARPVS